MNDHIPAKPDNAFRVTIILNVSVPRLDAVLLEALRKQNQHNALRQLSRNALKELFKKKLICIKGQPAKPSSSIAQGTTYVDIHGFADTDPVA